MLIFIINGKYIMSLDHWVMENYVVSVRVPASLPSKLILSFL